MITTDVATVAPAPASTVAGGSSRLARNLAFLAGGQVATWGLSLLWTIFVPRALGPRGLGELTIAYAATGVVSVVVSLGVGTLMVKEIARDRLKAPWMLGTAFVVRALFVVPSVAAIALYIRLAGFGGEQAVVIWMATASMILVMFTGPLQSVFQAIERMEFLAYADVLSKAAVTVLSIAVVLVGFGVVPVMAIALGMATVVLALNLYWSRGRFGIDWHIDRGHIRYLVVESLPYWSTGLVLTIYMWIDSVMLGFMSSQSVVGYYAAPTKLFSTLLFVPVILATAFLPRLSAAFRDGSAALQKAGRPALELVIVLGLPIAVGVVLVAKPAINVIYGPAFAPAVPVLFILGLTLAPTYFNVMVNQLLVANNRQLAWTKVMVASAIVNPALNLVLIRYFQSQQHNGAIGAALSLLATEIGMAVAGLILLPPILGRQSLFRFLRTICATGGMALVVLWLRPHLGFVMQVAVGGVTFAMLAVALRLLSSDELELVRGAMSRVIGRSLKKGSRV
ncbi:MAG TPA: flippase [Candidatus Acidoferrum sp.]|nr:flippase [Candidatus Acidoferrum sp.]